MPATRYLHGRDKRAVTQCDTTRCTEVVTVLTKNGTDTLRETLYVSLGQEYTLIAEHLAVDHNGKGQSPLALVVTEQRD